MRLELEDDKTDLTAGDETTERRMVRAMMRQSAAGRRKAKPSLMFEI